MCTFVTPKKTVDDKFILSKNKGMLVDDIKDENNLISLAYKLMSNPVVLLISTDNGAIKGEILCVEDCHTENFSCMNDTPSRFKANWFCKIMSIYKAIYLN